MSIPFVKMQGLGNDFIVIDELKDELKAAPAYALDAAWAKKICDRRWGVGADQVLWLRRPQDSKAHARMEILNADGSVAEMCGNGIRAVAIYLRNRGPEPRLSSYCIETLAGKKTVAIDGSGLVRVDMGIPVLGGAHGIHVQGRDLQVHEVNMGNPHGVFFVDRVSEVPLEQWGPQIESHPRFPYRTNVEFVEVLGPSAIQVRVWERGAGITLACGTGACASAVASLSLGKVKGRVTVRLPGGALEIEWAGPGQTVWMSGPAEEVYEGAWPWK